MQLGADGVEISAHGFCAPDHKDIYKASDDLAAMAARIGEYENKIQDFEKQDAAPIQSIAGDLSLLRRPETREPQSSAPSQKICSI